MVSENVKSNHEKNRPRFPEEFSVKKLEQIELYSIIALFFLIASVLLIAFNQKLAGGCMILCSASLGLLVFRKTTELNRKYLDSIYSCSSLNERKDKVITDFSHKIREPLNNLVITCDMLNETGLNTKQKELLETFVSSTKNMVSAVNDLTMESAENMNFETRKHIRFNLLSTIQHTMELYNLKDKANIDFILESREFSNLECVGDPIILKQIILDLFNTIENQITERVPKVKINLIKDTDYDSEKQIGLRIETDSNFLLIDDKSVEGSHAAKLISLSKGNYSRKAGENFSSLSIFLPYRSIPEQKPKAPSSKIEELIKKEKVQRELRDLRILLVEDNMINQKITLLTLMPLVHSIDSASNGKEALDKFGTNNYDLILMDIQMPVMSGLTAAEKIRALESTTNTHVPIIAITANAMIGDKEKCLSAGIDDYISKPFQPAQLVEKIRSII